jgi:hypothetical protein
MLGMTRTNIRLMKVLPVFCYVKRILLMPMVLKETLQAMQSFLILFLVAGVFRIFGFEST